MLFLLFFLKGDDDDDDDVEMYKLFFNDDFVDELTDVEIDDDVGVFLVFIFDYWNEDIEATLYNCYIYFLLLFSSSH